MWIREARRRLSTQVSPHHRPPVPLPRGRPVSPLVDPGSVLSKDPADIFRARWLARFRPLALETEEQRSEREARRRHSLTTRKGHTERLLNSPQRFDVASQTTLPNDLLIGLALSLYNAQAGAADPGPEGGIYFVPGNVMHRDWIGTDHGPLTWAICCQETLQLPAKRRGFFRRVRRPRFGRHFTDQVGSQLVRRAAQEIVVWTTGAEADSDRPTALDTDELGEMLAVSFSDRSPPTGALLLLSDQSFRSVHGWGDGPQPLIATLSDGTPCWNVDGLLAELAKDPPAHSSAAQSVLVTAATSQEEHKAAKTDDSLQTTLRRQIFSSLSKGARSPVSNPLAYSIPLSASTYPVILALRRCTWWLGQGWEPSGFPGLEELLESAEAVRQEKQTLWEAWQKDRFRVQGEVDERGALISPWRKRMRAVGQDLSDAL